VGGVRQSDQPGVSQFDLAVQRKLMTDVDIQQAAALVRGTSPAAAARVLQLRLPLEGPPRIELSPAWWPWLPLIPFRINLISS
jgi:hypothetical protein